MDNKVSHLEKIKPDVDGMRLVPGLAFEMRLPGPESTQGGRSPVTDTVFPVTGKSENSSPQPLCTLDPKFLLGFLYLCVFPLPSPNPSHCPIPPWTAMSSYLQPSPWAPFPSPGRDPRPFPNECLISLLWLKTLQWALTAFRIKIRHWGMIL